MLILDTETYLIRPGLCAPPIVCFSFWQPGRAPWLLDRDRGCSALEYALDLGELIVGQYIAFDLANAAEYRPHLLPKIFAHYEKGLVRDVGTRQKLIDISQGIYRQVRPDGTRGYHLADLEQHYLGKDRHAEKKGDNIWRLRYAELDGVPPELWPADARKYALDDAEGTGLVFQAQQAKYGDIPDEQRQASADWALHLVRCWGIRTDGQVLDETKDLCTRIRNDVRERLVEKGYFQWEGPKKEPRRKLVRKTAPIQAAVERAFAAMGRTPPKTDSGATKTDADTLEMTGDPDLIELAETGPASTILKTFEPALRPGVAAPINTRYDLVETGRPSSSEPNLNNIPRGFRFKFDGRDIELDIRTAVVPREGFLLCSVDYDCAELRSCAQNELDIFGYSEMAEFFQNEPTGDPHLELAASVLGISSDEAKRLKAKGDKTFKNKRQAQKPVNFGLPGGLGAARLKELARKGYDVEMTEDEARLAKQQWFKRWPTKRRYLDYISNLVGFGDAQITHLWSGRKQGGLNYCDAANAYFQGRTADYAKLALFRVVYECYCVPTSPLFGSRVVGFLYDEILAEVPCDIAHEAAHRIADIMVEAARVVLPDVPSTASPALMERWYKAAEAVYLDEAGLPTTPDKGRLSPWRPKAAA